MTNTEKLNIIIKTQFNNVSVGVTPTTFYDESYIEYKITSYNTQCELSNNTKRIKISNSNTSKLYIDTVFSTFKTVDFSTDIEFDITTLTADNTICSISTNSATPALNFRIFIRNTYEKGITISANGWTISANYQFVINKKYVLSFTKKDDVYQLYIDGVSIGYKYSPTFTNNIITGSYYFILGSSNISTTTTSTSILNGNIYSFNYSIGPSLIHNQGFSRYGKNLISNLKFGNNGTDTSTTFYMGIETIYNAGVNWTLPTLVVNNGNLKLNGVPLSTNYTGKFTLDFNINSNTSQTSNIISYLGVYQLNMNIVGSGLPDPSVIVNTNTKSALDFENGIIDQIGTTVWTKEGTANVTSVNKIFGDNSLETKALGDSLYTNSNIITGGSTPFTIEFYALISKQTGWADPTYIQAPLISKNGNSSATNQQVHINFGNGGKSQIVRQASIGNGIIDSTGTFSVKYNDINKYTLTYDGAALRLFINNKLDNIVGTSAGILMNPVMPFKFFDTLVPAYTQYRTGTYGLIDNINIFDGIATKVRDPDPYEEFLVVDLAFDGENNSTKIIDNTVPSLMSITPLYYTFNALNVVGTISGTISIANNSSPFSDKSAYFNSSYITHNSSESLNLNNKDFTISTWVKFDNTYASSNNYPSIIAKRQSGDVWDYGIECNLPSRTINFVYNNQSYINIINNFDLGTWMHICVTCKDGYIYTFYNGNLTLKTKLVAAINSSSTSVLVGRTSTSWNDNYLKGYLKDFSLISGYCLYTESFSLPTEPNKDYNRWTVAGNAKLSTAQPFDGFSSLDTNSGYVYTYPNPSFKLANEFTISFDFMITARSASGWNHFFSNNTTGTDTYYQCAYYEPNKSLFFDVSGGNSVLNITATKDLLLNIKYNVKIIKQSGNMYLYLDNVLLASIVTNIPLNLDHGNGFIIGTTGWSTATTYHKGYIKNFKIYKGVAVIPESPTGKIQLDFDNNLTDKYNNSTWTNNGVTFDQVNSVKGHAAYFDSSNNNAQLYSNTELLNFENKNFQIELDYKTLNNNKEWSSLLVPQNHSYPSQHIEFSTWNSNVLVFQNLGTVNKTITGVKTLLNQWYNAKLIRNKNCVYVTQNDVITAMTIYSNNDTVNFNISNNCSIGGVNSNKFGGYIDNFKSYKEDFLNDLDIYKTNSSCIVSVDGGMLRLYSVASNGIWFKNKDCPNVKDFIFKTTIIKTLGEQSIILRTSNWRNVNDTYAYLVVINGTTIGLAKGSNSLTSTSFSWLKQSTSLDSTLTKYNIVVIANDNNIKIYCNDVLYIDYTGSDYLNSGLVGFRSYGVADYKIDYYSIEDLNNNILYYKDWKSKVNNVIDRPAVHLPLETNAINTGFTPLTIDSVGSPTYNTIDGKKCIKFESGKYLTINSNNIFNLGTSSDFYIELDLYIPTIHSSGSGHTILNGNGSTNLNSLWLTVTPQIVTGNSITKSICLTIRNPTGENYNNFQTSNLIDLSSWNNFKFYRVGNTITLELNGVKTEFANFPYPIDLATVGTFIGSMNNDSSSANFNGYMSNFKMFVGTSEIPETYNDKKVLDLDFKPTRKSYLFKDNNNKCVIHPVNITQRDYQDSQYCCTFNGTNQYLQLGKNDLFNFGNDDFVINIKFEIYNYTNGWNMILGNGVNTNGGITTDRNYSYISISPENASDYKSVLTVATEISNTSWYIRSTSIKLPLNEIIDAKIICANGDIKILINGVDVTIVNQTSTVSKVQTFNLNALGNTTIGCNADNHYFNGTIYSIKVLRNTSDITLLNPPVLAFNKTYTLTNGVDSLSMDFDNAPQSVRFINDENTVSAIINDLPLTVNKVDTIGNTDNLILFNDYIGTSSDIKMYDTVLTDNDTFVYDGPYNPEFGEVELIDSGVQEFMLFDTGNYTVDMYVEGYRDHELFLYNDELQVVVDTAIDRLIHPYIEQNYLYEYSLNDSVTGKKYKIIDMGAPGDYTVLIESRVCLDSDFCVRVYRHDTGNFIGQYELNKSVTPYSVTIPNLDTTKTYDIMLFDKNTMVESRMMSDRSPTPY